MGGPIGRPNPSNQMIGCVLWFGCHLQYSIWSEGYDYEGLSSPSLFDIVRMNINNIYIFK